MSSMASSSQSKVCCSSPTTSKNKANNSKSSRIWFSANKKSATFSVSSSASASAASFRQRFLHALQFYCDTPSLVLNSDLPADLVEFVTSQEFPVETLGVILELKRGVNVNSSTTTTTRASELSRRLAESWISADSCAEALGSLSLGDEVPGVIAETSSLYRLIFSISDNFHIPPEQFQNFILSQIIITIQALVYGVAQESYDGIIRSQVLGNLLDRTFLRFHSDAEQFFGPTKISTRSPTLPTIKKNDNQEKDDDYEATPFAQFVDELGIMCRDDFIARRLLSRILIGIGNQAAFKFAKTTFLIGLRDTCPAMTIFSPSDPFFTSPTWNNVLSSSIPLKTRTKSPLFWTNWAYFMIKSTSSTTLTSVWSNGVTSWQNLCRSSAVSCDNVLLPATYALIALAREIKLQLGEDNSAASVTTKNILVSSTSQVLESVAKCLDSTDEGKKACGMGLAQVMGDLHVKIGGRKDETTDSGHSRLKFTSKHAVFRELINFYENGFKESVQKSKNLLEKKKQKKIQVLDSDDDDDEDEDEEKAADDVNEEEASQLNHFDETDPPVDKRILDYRSKKGGRLPQYFSEIVEILLEGGGKNEVDTEAVKQYCIMRIPLLLNVGIRIDSRMAEVLIKCLLDFETSIIPSLELPILFSIYELAILHPTNVIEIIATAAFDDDHYTSGHRMVTLQRLSEVVQLLSKSKCFSCHDPELERHRLDLISISPDFITKYFNVKKKARSCSDCNRSKNVSSIPNSGEEQDGKAESDTGDLTWGEIVDRRVASKTRYFFKSRNNSSTATPLPDTYSTTLIPIIWASLANRILSKASYFTSEEERVIRGAPRDMLLAQMFRLLGRILLPGGGTCPHLGSIAGQVGHLAQTFATHPDGTVRQSVIALVAVTITISDGAVYVIEAISGSSNIFESLKQLRDQETLPENKALLDHIIAYMTQAAIEHAASSSSTSLQDGINSMLRFLPDRKLQLN